MTGKLPIPLGSSLHLSALLLIVFGFAQAGRLSAQSVGANVGGRLCGAKPFSSAALISPCDSRSDRAVQKPRDRGLNRCPSLA
jgi:hypothetical protein